jgi:hypothetical protein
MGVVLSLRDIVDPIDSQSHESEAYLDPAPGLFATSAALSNGSDCWMHGIAIARKIQPIARDWLEEHKLLQVINAAAITQSFVFCHPARCT